MIRLIDVTKLYDDIHGVKNINVTISDGQIVSLIGPNGAGKTTLLRIISNSLKKYDGVVEWGAEGKKSVHDINIGYMPDHVEISEKISTIELLYLINDYRFEGREKEYIQKMIARYDMKSSVNTRYCNLSLGMKKKILFIAALMGQPQMLILDEPTTGLDAKSLILLKEDILDCKKRGCSIVISGHMLDFLAAICDEHLFIRDGQIVRECHGKEIDRIYRELFF